MPMTSLPKHPPKTLRFPNRQLPVGERTIIMGILNVTPDSFSDGGRFFDSQAAIEHGLRMVEEGADILDIGGESSRPFADEVGAEEELRRVIPVIESLARQTETPISIDTYKAEVAREAVLSGAVMINDISGGSGGTIEVAAEAGVPIVLMHMRGTPGTMQDNPRYDDLMGEIRSFLAERASRAIAAGLDGSQVVIDPGIGFGKTVEHNLEIIAKLDTLASLNLPILVGLSRKSFIGKILDAPTDRRQEGTDAAVAVSVMKGAHIVRVHEVARTVGVVKICDAVKGAADS